LLATRRWQQPNGISKAILPPSGAFSTSEGSEIQRQSKRHCRAPSSCLEPPNG
jgi:hypothetical protein